MKFPASLTSPKAFFAPALICMWICFPASVPSSRCRISNLKKLRQKDQDINIKMDVAMGQWLETRLQIDLSPKKENNSDHWIEKADVSLHSQIYLHKLEDEFPGITVSAAKIVLNQSFR